MFDVLVFLYENFARPQAFPSAELLVQKLLAAGFEEEDVEDALDWIGELNFVIDEQPRIAKTKSMRIYSQDEKTALGTQAIQLIGYLDAANVIDSGIREVIINRVLACEDKPLLLEELKVVILLVFWRLEIEPNELIMEDLCSEDSERTLH